MRSIFTGIVTFRPVSSTTSLVSSELWDIAGGVRGEHERTVSKTQKDSAIAAGLILNFEEECNCKNPADLLVLFAKGTGDRRDF